MQPFKLRQATMLKQENEYRSMNDLGDNYRDDLGSQVTAPPPPAHTEDAWARSQ